MLFIGAHKEHELPDTHDVGRLLTHSIQLDPDAPAFHTALTAEYDDPMRYSQSLVIKTRLARRGKWHGIRKSWLSVQIKLPTGERISDAVWGIVIGWWRYPKRDEWSALLKAVRLGRDTDEHDATNFELPTRESVSGAVRDINGRRVDPAYDTWAGQQ